MLVALFSMAHVQIFIKVSQRNFMLTHFFYKRDQLIIEKRLDFAGGSAVIKLLFNIRIPLFANFLAVFLKLLNQSFCVNMLVLYMTKNVIHLCISR